MRAGASTRSDVYTPGPVIPEVEDRFSKASASPVRLGGLVALGGLVLGAASLLEGAAQFFRAVFLARILEPADFGLMGMAFVVAQAAESMSQMGFHDALVRKQRGAEDHLDTFWTVGVLRCCLICALLWIFAPLVGLFFDTAAATPVVRGTALAFLVQGFMNPAIPILERDLRFFRRTAPFVAGTLADFAASVALALVLRNVWAMVWGILIGKAVSVAASYVVLPYRPRFRIVKEQAVELYRYGRHITRSSAAEYIVNQMDRVLIGRLLGASSLGLYAFASRLANLPTTAAYKVVFGVAFPIFSRVQEDASRVRAGFTKAIGLMTALAAPVSAGLFAVGPDLVPVLFGARWTPMIPAFRILCAAGALLALLQLLSAIVRGVGRPDLGAHATLIQMSILAVTIYPATKQLGITGTAWCVSASALAGLSYLMVRGARLVGCGLREVARSTAPSIAGAALMITTLLAGRPWLSASPAWSVLVAEILVGSTLYVAAALSLDRALKAGLLFSFRSMWRPA